jgi:hypothetical protein
MVDAQDTRLSAVKPVHCSCQLSAYIVDVIGMKFSHAHLQLPWSSTAFHHHPGSSLVVGKYDFNLPFGNLGFGFWASEAKTKRSPFDRSQCALSLERVSNTGSQ